MRKYKPIILGAMIMLLFVSQAWANSAPSAGTVTPETDISIPGQKIYITTTHSDPDGWENLRYAALLVNTSVNGANCCYVLYNQDTNVLYLRNDGNTGWYTGGLGTSTVLANSYAKLHCADTTVSDDGISTLTVRWAITFRKDFAGSVYNVYPRSKDDLSAVSPWEDKGDREVLTAPERAVWVWSMADDIVLDSPGGSRADFFNFCATPHGNDDRAVTRVYLSAGVPGKDLVNNYVSDLRSFIADADSRGLKVECLTGDKYWATPEYRIAGEDRCDDILDYNSNCSTDSQRFKGIHYDVEPHGLHYSRGDPYDWDADNATLWTQYLTLLENCQTKVNTYNGGHTAIKFGADIAFWYDVDGHPGTPNDVQSRVDYVAIMDYRETGINIVNGAATEITNGNTLGKKVVIGVETAQAVPPDPETISFYDEGNEYMEEQLGYTAVAFKDDASFDGLAIHYYEDTAAGEVAYRGLWTDSFPGYHPTVKVLFPNGDEGIDFVPGATYNIRWITSDRDTNGDNLDIDIDYSSDGGANWTSIPTDGVNDGIYAWNTPGGLLDGAEYRVRVTATDPTPLSGSDRSDFNFRFRSTSDAVPDWSNAQNTADDGARPIIIPNGDILHMVWYWPGWGEGSSYVIYYKKSTDRGDTWSSPFALATDPGGSDGTIQPRKPALAVRDNTLAVVWVEGTSNGAKQVKVRISTDGGGTWGSASEIQDTYTNYRWADFPDITIDASNNIHVVWGARSTLYPYPWVIHYNSKTAGGGWAGRVTISEITASHVRATPAVTTDPNGIHVVWGEFTWSGGLSYKIKYRKKVASWGTVMQLGQGTVTIDVEWAKKYFPNIYSDSSDSNKLHVVWQYATDDPETDTAPIDSDIYYTSSVNGGSTWLGTQIDLADGYTPAICADESELRLIYYYPSATTTMGDIRYIKSTDGGSNWSGEATLTNDAHTPYSSADADFYTMIGFPSLASGSMVAAWRRFSSKSIVFSYKGVFSVPENLFADLTYGQTDSIDLRWDKPQGYTPNSYTLFRSVDDGGFSSLATNIYDVEYTDSGLSDSNYYKYKVKAVEGAIESGFSNISNPLYPGENFLVDYFEGFEGATYSKIGTSDLTWSPGDTDEQQGDYSLRLDYTYQVTDPLNWGAVLRGTLPATIDISNYETISIWVQSVIAGNTGIAVQFFETGRPEGNEAWSSSSPTITSTGWQQYEFYLTDFGRTTVMGNDHFDRDSIGGFQLLFSDTTANGTYRVDRLELHRAPPSLVVTPADLQFGTIAGSASNRRFQTPALNIKYGGFDTPWTVRVWTDNSPGPETPPVQDADKAGLRGLIDTSVYVPLKVWCSNYGPSAFSPPPGPNEESNYFWEGYDFNGDGDREDSVTSGSYSEAGLGFDINGDGDIGDTITPSTAQPLSEEPSWLRVPEKDEMDPNNRYTWRSFSWNDGLGDDAGLGGDFDIYLAIDTFGVKPQGTAVTPGYSTVLTVEYLNQ